LGLTDGKIWKIIATLFMSEIGKLYRPFQEMDILQEEDRSRLIKSGLLVMTARAFRRLGFNAIPDIGGADENAKRFFITTYLEGNKNLGLLIAPGQAQSLDVGYSIVLSGGDVDDCQPVLMESAYEELGTLKSLLEPIAYINKAELEFVLRSKYKRESLSIFMPFGRSGNFYTHGYEFVGLLLSSDWQGISQGTTNVERSIKLLVNEN